MVEHNENVAEAQVQPVVGRGAQAVTDSQGLSGGRGAPHPPVQCLSCSSPVDSERNLLGVVNRFQEMLTSVGYTVAELVMRSEPGDRTSLKLELLRDNPPEQLDRRLKRSIPDCAKRSSCRMCASACSISNCDANCDHEAAETSPPNVEHHSFQPLDNSRHGVIVVGRSLQGAGLASTSRKLPQKASTFAAPSAPAAESDVQKQACPPNHGTRAEIVQSTPGHHHHHHHHHHRHHPNRTGSALPGSGLPDLTKPNEDGRENPLKGDVSGDPDLFRPAGQRHSSVGNLLLNVENQEQNASVRNGTSEHDASVSRKRRRVNDVTTRSTRRGRSMANSLSSAPPIDESQSMGTIQPTSKVPEIGSRDSSPAATLLVNMQSQGDDVADFMRKHETAANPGRGGSTVVTDGPSPGHELPMCEACEEVFQSDLEAQRHRYTAHPAPLVKTADGRVECPVANCKQDFAREHVMRRHIQSVHLNIREFSCASCDRVFADQSTLNQHVTGVHLKKKPWTCSVCMACFTQSSSLGKHRRRFHTGDGALASSGPDESGRNDVNASQSSPTTNGEHFNKHDES